MGGREIVLSRRDSKCKGPEVGTRLVCLRKIQKIEEGGEGARAPEKALVNPGEAFRF